MSRRTRVEAARLAAKAVQGQCAEGDVGARVLALCALFENYIDLGVHRTDRLMRLFPDDGAQIVVLKGGKA